MMHQEGTVLGEGVKAVPVVFLFRQFKILFLGVEYLSQTLESIFRTFQIYPPPNSQDSLHKAMKERSTETQPKDVEIIRPMKCAIFGDSLFSLILSANRCDTRQA